MQKINHSAGYKALHPIFDEFERFYFATSGNSVQGSNSLIPIEFDRTFEPLQGIFNEHGKQHYNFSFTNKNYSTLSLESYDKNNIIIAFSGGKDSVATALKYKDLGYNIYLYHLRGLKTNSYPTEWKSAKELAEHLNLPLVIEDIQLLGKLDFPEHPLKNIIIANSMLQYGIKNHIGINIAFGNYTTSELDYTAFYYAGDDCIDMWGYYGYILSNIIPDFKVGLILSDLNDTLETMSTDKDLLALCQSCLGAHRFREYNRKHVQEKYGIELMPNRCGVCWKCAVEYIYMTDHNVLQYNEGYYKHCIDVLKKANKHENGLEFTGIQDLWNVYFKYDISESKWTGIRDYGKRKRIK